MVRDITVLNVRPQTQKSAGRKADMVRQSRHYLVHGAVWLNGTILLNLTDFRLESELEAVAEEALHDDEAIQFTLKNKAS